MFGKPLHIREFGKHQTTETMCTHVQHTFWQTFGS